MGRGSESQILTVLYSRCQCHDSRFSQSLRDASYKCRPIVNALARGSFRSADTDRDPSADEKCSISFRSSHDAQENPEVTDDSRAWAFLGSFFEMKSMSIVTP